MEKEFKNKIDKVIKTFQIIPNEIGEIKLAWRNIDEFRSFIYELVKELKIDLIKKTK